MIPNQQNLHDSLRQALLARDRSAVKSMLQELRQTETPLTIIDTLITPVLEGIGVSWEEGSIALSQVYMSGRLCEDMIPALLSLDTETTHANAPPIGIAVLHDHHVLGKRIVYSVLTALGYRLHDYGHGIEVTPLVERVLQDKVRLLLVSTLMLPSALLVRDLSSRLKAECPEIKIIVGGAPFRFDEQLWSVVGADAMGRTASDAISLVRKFSTTA
jgi:trimethylamine corrinoid protein